MFGILLRCLNHKHELINLEALMFKSVQYWRNVGELVDAGSLKLIDKARSARAGTLTSAFPLRNR